MTGSWTGSVPLASRHEAGAPSGLVLENGLRVLHRRQNAGGRTGISVHYGVGFRSEPESREGFAHLFEHLMFQGSQFVRQGAFHEAAENHAASVNGTTHQDYTDYYHRVAPWDLERAVFFEADRMRAPMFTRQTLAEQLDFVQQEIAFRTEITPYGGFPWPKTSASLFDRYPNAHDGFGSMERLRSVTVDECAEFFLSWYTPSNAVVTIVGDHSESEVHELAERYFAAVPEGPAPMRPDLREETMTGDRFTETVDRNVSVAGLNIGFRLAGPESGIEDYVATMVLAKLIGPASGQARLDAEVGYFGSFDSLSPEVLNVVAMVPSGDVDRTIRALESTLLRLSEADEVARMLPAVVGALRRDFFSMAADAQERSRFVGKTELLFDHPGLLDELPVLFARVTAESVTGAARALSAAGRAVVLVSPPARTPAAGHVRESPVSDAGGSALAVVEPGHDGSARALAGRAGDGAPTRVPVHGATGRDNAAPYSVRVLDGVKVGTIDDRRSPLFEVRIGFRLGPVGWYHPWAVAAMVEELRAHLALTRDTSDFELSISIDGDGEALTVSGVCEQEALTPMSIAIGELISERRDPTSTLGIARAAPDPVTTLSAAVARRAILGTGDWSGELVGESAEGGRLLRRQIFSAAAANVVLVGSVSRARVEDVISEMAFGKHSPMSTPPPVQDAGRYTVHVPGDRVVLTDYFLEPSSHDDLDGARYAAAAVFGASPHSRIHAQPRLRDALTTSGGIVRRGTVAGFPMTSTRLVARPQDIDAVQRDLAAVTDTLVRYPPSSAEVRRIVGYCLNELRNIADSPAVAADHLVWSLTRGVDPSSRRDQLSRVTREQVVEVHRTMFAGPRITVDVGATQAEEKEDVIA